MVSEKHWFSFFIFKFGNNFLSYHSFEGLCCSVFVAAIFFVMMNMSLKNVLTSYVEGFVSIIVVKTYGPKNICSVNPLFSPKQLSYAVSTLNQGSYSPPSLVPDTNFQPIKNSTKTIVLLTSPYQPPTTIVLPFCFNRFTVFLTSRVLVAVEVTV